MRTNAIRTHYVILAAVAVLLGGAAPCSPAKAPPASLEIAKIHWEYNSSANDLGVHVSLDAEDWRRLKIVNPKGRTIFNVEGGGPYKQLGLTELFFEGAEPELADFPLEDLLALFPEGEYRFEGKTVDGGKLTGSAMFSHAIPAGPTVSFALSGTSLVISWTKVTSTPPGFPAEPINVVAYQVLLAERLDVTVPGTVTSLTVPPEFVASLPPGEQQFEVLA